MNRVFLLLIVFIILNSCLSDGVELTSENTIKMSECKEIIVQIEVGDHINTELYYLTSMERLSKLYKNDALAYVGSDETYHFFYWYLKVQHYEDQPRGFAVKREEYTLKNEFNIKENKIGEHPFPLKI